MFSCPFPPALTSMHMREEEKAARRKSVHVPVVHHQHRVGDPQTSSVHLRSSRHRGGAQLGGVAGNNHSNS